MKIVVRGTNWIGDAVMTIPALRGLRKMFPESHISLHTLDWARDVFRDADFIDEILTFKKERNPLKTVRSQAMIWRENKFDLAVLFTNSFQTALLAKLGKAKKRFGYKNEGRAFLLSNPIDIPSWRKEKHETFYYLNLISEIGKHFSIKPGDDKENPDFSLHVSERRRKEAREVLKEAGIDHSERVVAMGVGSENSRAKRWQPEGYARLNDMIQNELQSKVVLLGSQKEKEIAGRVSELSKTKPPVLAGKTSLGEAVSILAEADLLVSNDMGLAHVSSAVGTKTLTIFGPTNPKTTKPWNSEIIVRKDVECAPCLLRDCPIDHPCMAKIAPETVFEKAARLLS